MFEPVPEDGGGELLRVAQAIRAPDGRMVGVVLASDVLTGEMADRARRMTKAYEDYTQLRVLKQPLAGVYLSFFVMVTLLILVGSTWMGLYLAKRITRPVQMLSAAAREIGAGHLEHRIEHQADDEFGHMVEAFNAMAADLSTRQRRLERAVARPRAAASGRRAAAPIGRDDPRAHRHRRHLDRRAPAQSAASTRPRRGCSASPPSVEGRPVAQVLGPDLDRRHGRARRRGAGAVGVGGAGGEHHPRGARGDAGRGRHAACTATAGFEGTVLVLDDVTPLIRAQKVAAWREVARRLAHEIKNPLTPIQLSAERLQRKLGEAGAPHEALVEECTSTIIGEVESLKGLVDEFSQFARMPAPKAVPSSLNRAADRRPRALPGALPVADARASCCAADLPPVRLDPEQIKRVIINLVDNAVEAMDRQGRIVVETAHDPLHNVARVVVADDGPGIPAGDRDKLFLPYYSTKGRGSRAWAWPSCAASSPSTAATSKWRTTVRRAAGSPSSCRADLITHGRHPDRRRRTRRALRARRRAARRGLRRRSRRDGRGLPRAAGRAGVRRHPARRLDAGDRRPGDAAAAARAQGGRAGRRDLRARQHRVGGAGHQDRAPSTSSRSRSRSTRPCWSSATPCASGCSRPRTATCGPRSIAAT